MQMSQYDAEFINQISNIGSLFDLMALCISYLLKYEQKERIDFIEILHNTEKSDICIPLDAYLENRACDSDYVCIDNLKKNLGIIFSNNVSVIEACVQIIDWIDDHWEPEYDNDDIYRYSALNKQFYDEVRIIVRIKDNWISGFKKSFSDKTGYPPFRTEYPKESFFFRKIIKQYIVLDKNWIDRYQPEFIHLGNKNIFVRKLKGKQTLSFALFPVLYEDLEDYFNIGYKDHPSDAGLSYFEINGMPKSKEQILEKRYQDILTRCQNRQVDFLVFPEMLMTEEIYKCLRCEKSSNRITFWGSIWDNKTNRCFATGILGRELLYYDKKIGYEYKKNHKIYQEHIIEATQWRKYSIKLQANLYNQIEDFLQLFIKEETED